MDPGFFLDEAAKKMFMTWTNDEKYSGKTMFMDDDDLMKVVLKSSDIINASSLTEKNILKLNGIAMSGAIGSGVYRTGLVQLEDYIAIPPDRVPNAMKELVKQINQPTDAEGYKKLAIKAHLELVR